jgi:putative FmdB family regulatory protein
MPIYEYRCASCGHQQEYLQKLSDTPLTVCPQCGKPTFSKMVTAAGFQLKGSGWYVTDFRNKPSSKPGAKSESKGESTSEAKGEAKSEAKGDAKSESKSDAKSESKQSKPAAPSKPASSGDA